ncbi:MAG: hypothetical protein R3A79_14790 [Nannocystaceae bacterium]
MPTTNRTLVPFSIAAELEANRPLWPAALLPPDRVEAARAAASALPPIFHWVILEGRLTGADPRVDLMACLIDGPGVRDRVAAALRRPQAPLLEDARPLLEAWARPAAHARRRCMERTPLLWLEWDAPFDRAPFQLPFIDRRFWGDPGAPAAGVDELVAMIADGYAATFAEPYPDVTLALFRRVITALPRGARALAAASLRPRGIPRERLFVSVPQPLVLAWLDAVGWPGERAPLRTWLPRIVAPWEEAFLQIELDPATGAVTGYLGVEPRQTELSLVERRERGRLFARLVADGLADPARVAAIEAWTGAPSRRGPHRVVRSVHLKCVFQPAAPLEVKAYLGLHLRERGPARPVARLVH